MRVMGADITARRDRLGVDKQDLADEAGVNIDTLSDFEAGNTKPHSSTVRKVTDALDRLEHEMGLGAPVAGGDDEHPRLVRFTVRGVYGVEAVVLEGPVDNIAELEASLDRIMRRVAGRSGDHPPHQE